MTMGPDSSSGGLLSTSSSGAEKSQAVEALAAAARCGNKDANENTVGFDNILNESISVMKQQLR